MTGRIIWIDYAKTIAIYLVVLGHTHLQKDVQAFIYTFHLPLFFFLSGYLFSFEKHSDFIHFAKQRFIRLIIPYFFLSLISALYWGIVGKHFDLDPTLNISIYESLRGTAYGNGLTPWGIYYNPLWFLPCLFLSEIIYYFLFKYIKKKLPAILIFTLLIWIITKINTIIFPWSLNTSLVAVSIYGLGNISKKWLNALQEKRWYLQGLIMITCSIATYLISQLNGPINMHINYCGNYFFFLSGAISGIAGTITLSLLLEKIFNRISFIEYIAQNTLIILGLHLIIANMMKVVTFYGFDLSTEIYREKLWINIVFSFVSILLLFPAMFIANIWFPLLIGKRESSNLK